MTPEPTPELDLDAIEVRSALATAGPWHGPHEDGYGCVTIGEYGWVAYGSGGNTPAYGVDSDQGHADAEFIAHAREDVPALVAEVRRLRAVSSPPVEDTAAGLFAQFREAAEDYAVVETNTNGIIAYQFPAPVFDGLLAELEATIAARSEDPLPATGDTSDGYHTFDELYEYRMLYNAHAAQGWLAAGLPVVKSWKHSDGEDCFGGGWFIVMATLPTGQVSNHYRAEHWDLFDVPAVDVAPEYDGHTPAGAAVRLRDALAYSAPEDPLPATGIGPAVATRWECPFCEWTHTQPYPGEGVVVEGKWQSASMLAAESAIEAHCRDAHRLVHLDRLPEDPRIEQIRALAEREKAVSSKPSRWLAVDILAILDAPAVAVPEPETEKP